MKIAIASSGETLDAPVDPRFGRARAFILYDTESREWSVLDNAQNLNAPQGAGIQAASQVANAGAQAVLAGNCGPKAFAALSGAGLAVYTTPSLTVQQAIEKFRAGDLEPAHEANVGARFGTGG
ncbi:MAG: NifB/NifX family molybdenum-iron cluster-binding protein [Candidatus Brocadiia bacterium]